MAENKVSAVLSAEDVESIINSIQQIKDKLPFLIDLSTEEKKNLPKLGDKSIAFVNKAVEVAQQYADFLPRNFSVDELKKDFELYSQLQRINMLLRELFEKLDDTETEVGSELYVGCLSVYNNLKNNKIEGELELLLDDLGKKFAKRKKQIVPTP